MPRVRIRQLAERVATQGLHFGHQMPATRKLEPGEVVDIPEGDLFDQLYATGKIEIVPDAVTRPLTYKNEREARLCSPTFVTRGPDDEKERDTALLTVEARMAKEVTSEAEKPVAESPVTPKTTPATDARRARRAAAIRDQQVST